MNYDPLLGEQPQFSIPQLEEEQKRLSERLEQLKTTRTQVQPQRQAPVWDEIDSIVSGMSEQEIHMISSNEEFIESSNVIQEILQREYLRIMRPIVEGTRDGKDALDKHLTLIKRLRKSARDEVSRRYEIMDEYMNGYCDMPFNEFMKMKAGKNDSTGKKRSNAASKE